MTLYTTLLREFAGRSHLERLASLTAIVAGSLLMTAAARISIPFYPVPLSMQTFIAIGLGLALGPTRGALTILLYLAQGAAGFPVFAGSPERGIGLTYMAGPTGGFLIGFVVQAVVAGMLAHRKWERMPLMALAAALIAAASIYPTGLLWLGMVIGFDKPVLEYGFYPFILGDVVKSMLAAILFPLLWRFTR